MFRYFLGHLLVLPVLCFNIKMSSIDVNYTTTPESSHFINLDAAVFCKFQPNGYDCDGSGSLRPKFFYDIKLQDCKAYTIGNCPFNLNTFATLSDCRQMCRDVGTQSITEDLKPNVYCRLQHDFGQCDGYNPRWYFDITTRRCRGFSYSGCGGNHNRFGSPQACSSKCSGPTEHKRDLL